MRRDEQVIEAELVEIGAIQDDTLKLERIVAWCATYPEEVPFALHFFRSRRSGDGRSGKNKEHDSL